MTLAEMAKQMQHETVSPEIQELRRMRKFIAAHNYEEMNGRWAEVARLEANGGRDTVEGQYEILKRIKELNRDADLIKLYRATLTFAETRERAEAGAAFYSSKKTKTAFARRRILFVGKQSNGKTCRWL
ncbi:MAG: hypothetical protein PHG19_09575 [Anaerotignum sp.]|nr:hypothetical protein [Anaerotignum sp.]